MRGRVKGGRGRTGGGTGEKFRRGEMKGRRKGSQEGNLRVLDGGHRMNNEQPLCLVCPGN